MKFSEAVASGFRRTFQLRGRASRSEYWWFVLFYFVALAAAGLMTGLLAVAAGGAAPIGVVAVLAIFVCIVPSFTLLVRRLHDTDHSGWWVGLQVLIGTTGSLVGVGGSTLGSNEVTGVGALLTFVNFILSVVIFVWLCKRGTDGINRFGPDPLAEEEPAAVSHSPSATYWTPQAQDAQPAAHAPDADPYAVIGQEIETGRHEPSAWARALAFGNGDETKTKAEYVRLRLEQFGRSNQ